MTVGITPSVQGPNRTNKAEEGQMLCLSRPIHILLPPATGVAGILRRLRLNQELHHQPLSPQTFGVRLNHTTAFLVIQPVESRSWDFLAFFTV